MISPLDFSLSGVLCDPRVPLKLKVKFSSVLRNCAMQFSSGKLFYAVQFWKKNYMQFSSGKIGYAVQFWKFWLCSVMIYDQFWKIWLCSSVLKKTEHNLITTSLKKMEHNIPSKA
jgi:hypothetical protein